VKKKKSERVSEYAVGKDAPAMSQGWQYVSDYEKFASSASHD
jgi:hypothetical protein